MKSSTTPTTSGIDRRRKYDKTDKGRQSIIRKRYREAKTRLTKRIRRKEEEIANLEREISNVQED